jgi:hypothetical protein
LCNEYSSEKRSLTATWNNTLWNQTELNTTKKQNNVKQQEVNENKNNNNKHTKEMQQVVDIKDGKYSTYNTNIDQNHPTVNTFPSLHKAKNIFNPYKGNEITHKNICDTRIIFQNINSLHPKTTDKWKATLEQIHQ